MFYVLSDLYFRDKKQQMKHLEKIGVPGPKPHLFRGHLPEIKEKVKDLYIISESAQFSSFLVKCGVNIGS